MDYHVFVLLLFSYLCHHSHIVTYISADPVIPSYTGPLTIKAVEHQLGLTKRGHPGLVSRRHVFLLLVQLALTKPGHPYRVDTGPGRPSMVTATLSYPSIRQ